MKKFHLAAAAVAALAIAGSASAEGAVAYNASVTSDYVFRGVSQTAGKAAIQGGIDYTNGMFYAGTWASNVSFAAYELDLYAGVRPVVGKFSFDAGLITYQYADKGLNLTEAKGAVTYALPKGTIGAAFYDNIDAGKFYYYEVNGSYPLSEKFSLSGAIGEQSYPWLKYSTANVGLTYIINPTFSIDGRISGTNLNETVKDAKPRVSVTVKAAF